jgi:light-regulated signal transduction histidine kinase (bacteriophytochrome)
MQPDEIHSLRASLDESEKATEQFLNRIVHDLRSVRRAVGISAELLVGGGSSSMPAEQRQQTVQHLNEGLTKMDAIVSGASD